MTIIQHSPSKITNTEELKEEVYKDIQEC